MQHDRWTGSPDRSLHAPSAPRWVLREVLRQQRAWLAEGLPPVVVTVKASARQFRQQSSLKHITDALRTGSVAPALVPLALSEATLRRAVPVSGLLLDNPHALGVRLALDDFGLGWRGLVRASPAT